MPKAKLFLRQAQHTKIERYQEASVGSSVFTWASFRQEQIIQMALEPIDGQAKTNFYFSTALPKALSKKKYLPLIEHTIQSIAANNWGKVVMSRAKVVSQKVKPLLIFNKLCQAYPGLTIYLFTHPKAGTWCGATPETLISVKDNTLKTMSLAGTRSLNTASSFSAKEYKEQAMVTEFIKQTLTQNRQISQVEVSPVKEVQAARVAHLQSLIAARVPNDFNTTAFLRNLHPTPAVSGHPRQAALNFIDKHEGYARSFYSGYFGLNQQQQAHYWVNLRCMQIFENNFALYAGGGITAQSKAAAEWQETEDKMNTLLSIIKQ
jgi:isochorismate synthase